MKDSKFSDKVRQYFSWLETTYHFKLNIENNSDVRPTTDGVVEYGSNTTVVVIDSEIGDAAVWYYRILDGKKHELDPVVMDEYLSTNTREKSLLLSTNPKDQQEATALANRKFLLAQPGWKSASNNTQEKLELRLSNYAKWLMDHAQLCLTGDFSEWPNIYEYKILRTRADHLRRGKDEMGYVRAKDSDGNTKLVKQSIFKEKLEHIEKLKKEFSNK